MYTMLDPLLPTPTNHFDGGTRYLANPPEQIDQRAGPISVYVRHYPSCYYIYRSSTLPGRLVPYSYRGNQQSKLPSTAVQAVHKLFAQSGWRLTCPAIGHLPREHNIIWRDWIETLLIVALNCLDISANPPTVNKATADLVGSIVQGMPKPRASNDVQLNKYLPIKLAIS